MTRFFRNLMLATTALLPLGIGFALAGPLGGTVVGGGATIDGQGSGRVTINQHTNRAIINWYSFNIGAGETTQFIQPDSGSIALNRVTGGLGPSEILGTLSANGRVFVINRDGVLFGPNAVVDTAGFLATTSDIKNADFMAGRYNFNIPGRPDASIVNQGVITAHNSGFAALVAPGVRNTGTITATLGTVGLAAGNSFTLDFYGDRLITLAVGDSIGNAVRDAQTGQSLKSLVENTGKLRANGGRVELTAATARHVVDSVINNRGVIEANRIGRHGGTIVLSAGTAATKGAGAPKQTVKVSGTLSAKAKKQGQGGKIVVTGENIEVAGARIDASGPAGGGTVLIGGDWAGGHPRMGLVNNPRAKLENEAIPTATTVTVDGATTINASATQNGTGGKVIVWADGSTAFHGSILARGGESGGGGGFAEVSGHQHLDFRGTVDLRAPFGKVGTLLLDPADYYIQGINDPPPPTGASVITNVALQNQLALANVVIATDNNANPGGQNGDIFVNAPVVWNAATTLTLSAFHDIRLPDIGTANLKNTGAGNLILRADATGTGSGTIVMPPSTNLTRVDWTNSTGTVTVYYNPTSYATPTNFTAGNGRFDVASPSQLTSYMLVNDFRNLQDISTNLSGTYALGTNFSAAGFNGFAPGTHFTGILDGNGGLGTNYTISNLQTTLFPFIDQGAIVRNLSLSDVNVAANGNNQFVGALAGVNQGTITNVHVTGGVVSGGSFTGIGAGGLVGQNAGTITLSDSAAIVAVDNGSTGQGGFNSAGGLAGVNLGMIDHSTASGVVAGGTSSFVGGLVGSNGNSPNSQASITSSSASGTVTGLGSVGGLVGFNAANSTITGSQASGSVTAVLNGFAGGLVGQNDGTVDQSSYSAGVVSGFGLPAQSAVVGGLIGVNHGTVTNSIVAATATVTGNFVAAGGLVGSNSANSTISGSQANANVSATGNSFLGGLVGQNSGAVTNSFAGGTVVGTGSIGGLVGVNSAGATITTSHADGSVTGGTFSLTGGLVGQNEGAVNQSFATGTVTQSGPFGNVGGLVGDNHAGGIIDGGSHASGHVIGSAGSSAGGLVGQNQGGIGQSFATGSVTGGANGFTGGLVGNNHSTITGSQASGSVTAGAGGTAGGLVGQNDGAIASSTASGAVSGTGTANQFVSLGGLVGSNSGGAQIIGSTASGTVTIGGFGNAGGLVGQNNAALTNVTASNTVISTGLFTAIGGLVGFNGFGGTITNSQAFGTVASMANGVSIQDSTTAGGLVGINQGAVIGTTTPGQNAACTQGAAFSCASGAVSVGARGVAGGLVGFNMGTGNNGLIGNAFASGPVTGAAGLDVHHGSTNLGGLAGTNFGTITDSHATGNVGTLGVAFLNAGGLVGDNSGAITKSYATGNVRAGDNSSAGGLVADNSSGGNCNPCNTSATITGSQASGSVIVGAGSIAGGFAGVGEGTLINASASGAVTGGANSVLGGLVGGNFGTISGTTTASGAVTGLGENSVVGGLVGFNLGQITGASSSGAVAVASESYGGGLVGINLGVVAQSTTGASVTGSGDHNVLGGLVGGNAGTITQSSAAGAVSGATDSVVGGLVGANVALNNPGGLIVPQGSFPVGTVTQSSATGAVSGGDGSIVGGLIGENGGSISGLSASNTVTGGVGSTVGGLVGVNAGLHWAPALPGLFGHCFDPVCGQIAALSVKEGPGTIANSHASGNVSGGLGSIIGGLVGENPGSITGSDAAGTVTGAGALAAGGLTGDNSGSIANSSATGAVNVATGFASFVGGLAGHNEGTITHASASGAVTGTGLLVVVGGLVGLNDGTITQSIASGAVSGGDGSFTGGLAGWNILGTITQSSATGAVTGGDGSLVGGLVGFNLAGLIQQSFATGAVSGGAASFAGGLVAVNLGTVSQSFATGAVSGGDGSQVGGLVALNFGIPDLGIGVISQSYATGSVTGGANSTVGGLVADNGGTIDQTFATGRVSGGPGSTLGGLVAVNSGNFSIPGQSSAAAAGPGQPGTVTNSYWDRQSTGQTSSAGGTSLTTAQLIGGLPAGFDPLVWSTGDGRYPFLLGQPGDTLPPPPVLPPPEPQQQPPPQPLPQPLPLPDTTNLPLPPQQQIVGPPFQPDPQPVTPAALVTPPSPPAQASRANQGRQPNQQAGTSNGPLRPDGRPSNVPPPNETRFIDNEVVFQICTDVPAQRIQATMRRLALSLLSTQSLGILGCTVYHSRITTGRSVRDIIIALERDRLIDMVTPNYTFDLAQDAPAGAAPADPQGDPAQYAVSKLRLAEAHRIATGDNVLIAVIDSEIDAKHPDLEGRIASRYDAVGPADKPHPHGTGMAGAIVSHRKLMGTAPGARILAIRAFGGGASGAQGTTVQIVQGLDWAIGQGARIVNMSFAGPKDPTLQKAFKAAYDKGVVLIAAAGNAGPKSPPLYPGADGNVIAVGATDADDKVYTNANRGKYVAVAAPGVEILVPAPDGNYEFTTGTSVAAAEVSGIAALLLQRDPKLDPAGVRDILTSTAKYLGAGKGRNDETGSGLVDPYQALLALGARSAGVSAPGGTAARN